MQVYRRLKLVLLLTIMLTSLTTIPQSDAALFVFAWQVVSEDIDPPFETNFFYDIYYNPDSLQGYITFHALGIWANRIKIGSSIFGPNSTTFNFETFTSSELEPFGMIGSTFYHPTNSIFVTGSEYSSSNNGIHLIQLETEEFVQNHIEFPDLLAPGSNILAMEVNPSTSQIVLITSSIESGGQAFLYDLNKETWTETSGDVPHYAPSWGALSVDHINNKTVYFIDRETAPDEDGKTHIFDFDTNQWKEVHSKSKPTSLTDYSFVYNEAIDHHVLIGGRDMNTGELNKDIWIFSTETEEWTLVFEDLLILGAAKDPKFYYDPYLLKLVGFGKTAVEEDGDPINRYSLFRINMERIEGKGVEVDLGVPTSTILLIGTLAFASFSILLLIILIIKRKSIFTAS